MIRHIRRDWNGRTRTLATGMLVILVALAGSMVRAQTGVQDDETVAPAVNSAAIARRLSSHDPLERQRAAEELARLAAMDQQKMVEGYRLEEKNARVRLALDWARYRMGKSEALFAVVRDLDSSRRDQAEGYLRQLDGPQPLYAFFQNPNARIQSGLLEVLGHLGDADTLDRIKYFAAAGDARVASAAQAAMREITLRLRRPQPQMSTRPREVKQPGTE